MGVEGLRVPLDPYTLVLIEGLRVAGIPQTLKPLCILHRLYGPRVVSEPGIIGRDRNLKDFWTVMIIFITNASK